MAVLADGTFMEVIRVERGHEGVLTVKTAMYYWPPEATGCWLLLKWTLGLGPTAVCGACGQAGLPGGAVLAAAHPVGTPG